MKIIYMSGEEMAALTSAYFGRKYSSPSAGLYEGFYNEIYINADIPKWKQYWVLIHEIGHWFLIKWLRLHLLSLRTANILNGMYDIISILFAPVPLKDRSKALQEELNALRKLLSKKGGKICR